MCAPHRYAGRHPVPFGDQVFDGDVQVGEGFAGLREGFLGGVDELGGRIVGEEFDVPDPTRLPMQGRLTSPFAVRKMGSDPDGGRREPVVTVGFFVECSLGFCFCPKGRGSTSAMDTSDGWGHDGAPWTLRPNPSTPCGPSELA